MRLTQKLINLLHRVFDKDPGRFLALRLSYDGGMSWRVEDGVLTTSVVGGSGESLTVDLSQYTLGALVAYLAAQPGYTVLYADTSELSLLSALVLLDGENNIALSNGDHLSGYRSVLWSYMEAAASELAIAEVQIGEMLKQMTTKTGEGEWLDEIGGYYGIPRLQGEPDAQYGPRIIAEVLRPRGNNVAMEDAIRVFTGQTAKVTDVTLYGDTFPLYDGAITHNGGFQHNAAAEPFYGLFDVEYGYDLLNGGDIEGFKQVVQDLINRLRDAGTHLRSLLLRGSSDLTDTFPAAPTDGGPIAWAAASDMTDDLTPPDDPEFRVDATFGALSDALVAPADGADLTIVYDYRYNGVRKHDGTVFHLGGETVAEAL